MPQNAALDCDSPTQPLKLLQRHAWDLGDLVADWGLESGGQGSWHHRLADWLRLAGGLHAVEIDTGRFDESLMMCGRAAEYEGARSEAVSTVQTEFTRLLYVWCAYEELRRHSAADLVDQGEVTDRVMRGWLADNWDGDLPLHFQCALRGIRRLAAASQSYQGLIRYTTPSEDYPQVVLGLRVAGQLRHRLAHGDLVHPTPAEWGGRPDLDSALARGGTRLLLFSLQMLVATITRDHGVALETYDDHLDEVVVVPLPEAVLRVGLEREEAAG